MQTKYLFIGLILLSFLVMPHAAPAWDWGDIKDKAEDVIKGKRPLSNDEVIRGLKEALEVGTNNSVRLASKINGYYKNPRIFIPFPPKARKVKETVEKLGMKSQVEKFVMTLNRAAEEAAKEAAPIFLNAIKGMTIQDGFQILNGGNNAATQYLRRKTWNPLYGKFQPVVKRAINKVGVTRYWNPIITRYNKLPMTQRIDPNLDQYVTNQALKGLFKLIASEESKIRKNPAARVTELLRRVFGSQS